MKTWTELIENAIEQKNIKKWNFLYWCVDLHDTVISGKYNRYNSGSTIYPYAKETLDYLYNHSEHKTILWTSSYNDSIAKVLKEYDLNFHYLGENPECPNTDLCNFDKKFYFNFLLDDKSGFDPNKDWLEIYTKLSNL